MNSPFFQKSNSFASTTPVSGTSSSLCLMIERLPFSSREGTPGKELVRTRTVCPDLARVELVVSRTASTPPQNWGEEGSNIENSQSFDRLFIIMKETEFSTANEMIQEKDQL